MAGFFQWLQWSQAQAYLASRLADPSNIFWSQAENQLYLTEALRVWNALTETWNSDLAFGATSSNVWYNLSTLSGSPRIRTVTDVQIYTLMEYMLLEPASGGTWTGTSQFGISDLSGALQRRRDEVIQVSGCNLQNLPALPSTPGVRRTIFPDSTLEPIRMRFIPDSSHGSPSTLSREDTIGFDAFESQHYQQTGTPRAWSVVTGPPLAMDVDVAPNTEGEYDPIVLYAGLPFNPPTATLIGVPDDWSWLPKWGALYDLLSRESEATDRQRADYCLKRYQDGLKIMKESNWLVNGRINGYAVSLPSLREMDAFSPEWENNAAAWPCLVQAGMDFIAPCPVAPTTGVSCVVVGNAPIPVYPTDYVQVSRDVFDVILDYAQVLACFKMGGEDFMAAKDLEDHFYLAALETNKRLLNLGIFTDLVHSRGQKQNITQPR